MNGVVTAVAAAAVLLAGVLAARWWLLNRRQSLGSPIDRATYTTLHAASRTAPALRGGLDAESAAHSLPHIRTLLGTPTVAINGTARPLARGGPGHPDRVAARTSADLERR